MITFGYSMLLTVLVYIMGTSCSNIKHVTLNDVKVIPSEDIPVDIVNPIYDGKEIWKLNWIPPKHLRMDKYYYKNENQ